ncbi:hypothetical protein CFOL_v3_18976 [Cephalotus follicularis]|uniref:Uncharacterized protein n=1 Tax=Cephalotus follicularis TaxID=3775 RepID=A0A1Q3C5H1_CEPFO|nr:hypothetical protein CFOL_v3_18976 [Cephalotus follicularis]
MSFCLPFLGSCMNPSQRTYPQEMMQTGIELLHRIPAKTLDLFYSRDATNRCKRQASYVRRLFFFFFCAERQVLHSSLSPRELIVAE